MLLSKLEAKLEALDVGKSVLQRSKGGVVGYLVHALENLLDKVEELVCIEQDVAAVRGLLYSTNKLESEYLGEVDSELGAFFSPGSWDGEFARLQQEGAVLIERKGGGTWLDACLGKKLVALFLYGTGACSCSYAGQHVV